VRLVTNRDLARVLATRVATCEPRAVPLRDARDDDADGLIELIASVFAEYPGCVLDVDREIPQLRRIASAFRAWRGEFWVVEEAGEIIACVGYSRSGDSDAIELRKLYVRREHRRNGIGRMLCERVEQAAHTLRSTRIELWSDTRFAAAHRLYEKLGYVRGAETRALHDISQTVEYYYSRSLDR
jgi:putative acetyltransferase